MSAVLACSQHSNVAVRQEQKICATPEDSVIPDVLDLVYLRDELSGQEFQHRNP